METVNRYAIETSAHSICVYTMNGISRSRHIPFDECLSLSVLCAALVATNMFFPFVFAERDRIFFRR